MISVLGLDACDYTLAKQWNCDNILLDNHQQIETFSNLGDEPRTAEVWPVIATGKMPTGDEHRRGTTWTGAIGWLSKIGRKALTKRQQTYIGIILRSTPKVYYEHQDSMFADGLVWNWPGITPAINWSKGEYANWQLRDSDINDTDYQRRMYTMTGQEIGWLLSVSKLDVPIAGVHVHILDYAGHSLALYPNRLKEYYEHVDWLVGQIRDELDDLVVLSDHGIQTTAIDNDTDIGNHSWRSMISTTMDGELPEHVKDIRAWIEPLKTASGQVDSRSTYSASEEQLRSLGYL